MTAMAVSGLNEMILACEEGVARVRAEYSPDTGGPSHFDACGGELITNYFPLGLNNNSGKPVWVHIGPCHQQFVDDRRMAAERTLGFGD